MSYARSQLMTAAVLCGLRGWKIGLLYFLARFCIRQLNQALSVFSVRIMCVFCCLLAPLFVLTLVCVFMCSVSWLLLVKLSVLAKWLARKTPLRTLLCSKEVISRNLCQECLRLLVYYVVSLFYCLVVEILVHGAVKATKATVTNAPQSQLNKWVFSSFLNWPTVVSDWRSEAGRLFQSLGLATWKARSPKPVWVRGTTQVETSDERSRRRPTSETSWQSSDK